MIVDGRRAGLAGDAEEGRAGRLQLCPRELHLAQDLRAGTNCIKWVFPENQFLETIFKRMRLPQDLFSH